MSEVALPTLLPARIASEREWEGERSGKVPSIQNKMADVFFRLSYNSLTTICSHANLFSFSFVGRQTRTAVKVICLLISVQFIFFHAL